MARSHTVEQAIRAAIHPGQQLLTPGRLAPFVVERVDESGVVLLLGQRKTPTRIVWPCWEGIVPFMRDHGGEVEIGGRHHVEGNRNTLDEWLKTCIKRNTAGWVAAVLASAGVTSVIDSRPQRVRLAADWK